MFTAAAVGSYVLGATPEAAAPVVDIMIKDGDPVADAVKLFKSHFGAEPTLGAASPGR